MRRILIALFGLALALASETAFALACTSVGATWNLAANWTSAGNCNRIPTVNDSVTINTNMAVNVNTVNVQSITINSGFTLTQNTNTMQTAGALLINGTGVLTSGNTLTVTGATTVNGTLTLTAGTKTFTGLVTINNGGTYDNSAGVLVNFGNSLTLNSGGTFTSGAGTGVANRTNFTNATATITGTAPITFACETRFSGALAVAAGTVEIANATTVTTTTSVTGTLAITSATGTKAFTGVVTINNGGTWDNTSVNSPISFGAGLTNATGGTFSSGTGATTFTAAATVTGTTPITFNGATTFNSSFGVAAGTVNIANAVSVTTTTSVTGTLAFTSATGTKTFTGVVTVNNGGTWSNASINSPISFGAGLTNATGGTFNSGTGATTFTAAATVTGTAAITFNGATTFNSSLAVAAGTVNFADAVSVTTTTSVTGTLAITTTTGAKTFTGTVTLNVAASAWNNSANADVTLGANLTRTNGTFTSGTGTLTFTAATATLTGTLTFNGDVVANNVTLAAATTITNRAAAAITGNLAGTNAASSIWTNNAATNNVSLSVTGTVLTTGVLNASCTSPNVGTVDYQGTGQTVKAPGTSYCNLTISGTTATVAAATTVLVTGDLNVSGSFSPNATSTMSFTGTSGTQNLIGAVTFGNLTFNNSGTKVRVQDPLIVAGTFTLTAGVIDLDTDSSTIEVTSACPMTRAAGQIVGSLTLHYPTNAAGTTSCVFHIGTTTAYLPVTVAMTNVSSALANNTVTVRTDAGDHADVTAGIAGIDPEQSVNRTWTMTGGGSLVFLRHSTTFTFVAGAPPAGDVDSGAATATFEVVRLTGGTWSSTAPGVRAATTTQVLNETVFGIFAIGEPFDVAYAQYRMEEGAQLGGAIADTSGNGRNGTRLSNADTIVPAPTNPLVTICRALNIPNNAAFGTIDALDTSASLNGMTHGTITFWYKSTPLWNGGGDRQLLDASSSTTQAFSLYLPNNGRLTLTVSGAGTTGYVQTQNATSGIAANTWAHIGITWNFPSATFQIYVNGVLVASTQTTPGGAPNGIMGVLSSLYVGDNRIGGLIGGAAGFNTGNSANGVIDEVRIYNAVRSAAQVAADRTATYPGACNIAAIPGRFNGFETSLASTNTTGSINTKTSGGSSTVKLVALNVEHSAVDAAFAGVAKIELLDASDNSGTLDANQCRSSWTLISSPAPTVPDATFVAGVVASYSFTVPDAYKNVRLRITYPSTSTAAAALFRGCTADNFAVRPASLTGIMASDLNWTTAGTTRTLDNTGTVHKAGQPFTISVTAQNTASVTTANYNGSPTIVSGSATLLNPAPLSAECTGGNPACVVGTLTLGTVSGSGTVAISSTYNDVGAFSVQLEDLTWATVDLADANPASTNSSVPASAAVTIGRFVPNHFVVTALATPVFQTFGVADASCGGSAPKRSFTYIGQSFNWQTAPSVTLTAKDAGGNTTALYRGSLFKVTGSDLGYTYNGNSGGATFNATPATGTVSQNHNGTGTATAGADVFSYTRPASVLAPFSAAISITMDIKDQAESDGSITSDAGSGLTPAPFNSIAFDGGSFSLAPTIAGGKAFVYGRARMLNAYGSSTNDLPVTLTAEYYNGTTFATNTLDNCTSLSAGNFVLTTGLSGITVSISGTFAAGVSNLRLTKPSGGLVQGSAALCLDLDTNDGSCSGTAASKGYLQGQWGSANNDKDPKAGFGFGIYGQSKNLIYFRENY